ncbi:MAG TPA: hypothetical protein VH143_26855 [Kofleriaceae bacterium]|jgi:hypothetical protein|nr:hypothetical protein [Kofleriaceae bacterium]
MKVAFVVVMIATACSSSPPHEPSKAAPPVSSITVAPIDELAPPGPAYTGPLTVELVLSAKDTAHLFEPWETSLARLEAKLGTPTKIAGDKYEWAALRGDECADFAIEREDGAHYKLQGVVVGTIHTPAAFASEPASFGRADCLELAGVGITAEDSDAPGPKPLETIDDIFANAVRGRSKWDGRRVAVTAKVVQGGTTVMVADTRGEHAVAIEMKSGVPYPALRARVTLHCTVHLERWLGDDSTPSLEPALANCEI